MSKRTEKMLHGSCSEAYINGGRDDLATKIEVKVTGDFEDGAFCGVTGPSPSTTDMRSREPSPTRSRTVAGDRHHGGDTAPASCRTSC